MYRDGCVDKSEMFGMGKQHDYSMHEAKMDMHMNTEAGQCGCGCPEPLPGVVCPPIYECPQERCCHREIVHEVPHIVPINTRIINHHIYRHSFAPCFTCCEENVCCNVFDGPRCGR